MDVVESKEHLVLLVTFDMLLFFYYKTLTT